MSDRPRIVRSDFVSNEVLCRTILENSAIFVAFVNACSHSVRALWPENDLSFKTEVRYLAPGAATVVAAETDFAFMERELGEPGPTSRPALSHPDLWVLYASVPMNS